MMNTLFTKYSLVADSLSLCSHWVYDQELLKKHYANKSIQLDDPLSSYHPNRSKGQFTHYGDQVSFLEQFLKAQPWNLAAFQKAYPTLWTDYTGYIDGATKTTLLHLETDTPKSKGSDLAGASRIAPFLDIKDTLSTTELRTAIEQYIRLTHDDEMTVEVGFFTLSLIEKLSEGATIKDVLLSFSNTEFSTLEIESITAKAISAADSDHTDQENGNFFGLACGTLAGFSLSLCLLLRYPQQFEKCLMQNALIGGETAARASFLSFIYAAQESEKTFVDSTYEQLQLSASQ